ncbi:MAG: hypothetical protein H7Y32_12860 [Chloroflexales bacterium]|nr:hypothetical protein [Chloroflexales bacterium]
MALITKATDGSVDAATAMFAPQRSDGLLAGEALDALAPCYIKASDGKVYMSNGTAADEAAEFDGFTPRAYSAAEAVTLFGIGTRMRYATGLTPGATYFIAATAGRLDTAATTGDAVGVARSINATTIRITRDA